MTSLKRRKVISGLKRKVFALVPKQNDLWYGLTIDGEFVPNVMTFMSGGGKSQDIGEDNIQNMKRELHMDSKRQFINYISCTYKQEHYLEQLREKGKIE